MTTFVNVFRFSRTIRALSESGNPCNPIDRFHTAASQQLCIADFSITVNISAALQVSSLPRLLADPTEIRLTFARRGRALHSV